MPWVRIDDKAMEHPKIVGLSDGAFRLWVEGLAHCQKYLTDGNIDPVSLRKLRAFSPKRMGQLIASTLWSRRDGDAVSVHQYLDWNDSRARVEKVRKQGRVRVEKFRGNGVTGEACNALQPSGVGTHVTNQQDRSNGKGGGTGEGETPSQRAGAFCEFYGAAHLRFVGVGYLGNPQNDYQAALRLVATFTDGELRDAALVWFGMDDDFAAKGTRSIPKFASRASQCVLLAKGVVR